jgi:hypothetical protein
MYAPVIATICFCIPLSCRDTRVLFADTHMLATDRDAPWFDKEMLVVDRTDFSHAILQITTDRQLFRIFGLAFLNART